MSLTPKTKRSMTLNNNFFKIIFLLNNCEKGNEPVDRGHYSKIVNALAYFVLESEIKIVMYH
jgi:hypothetical protein